MAALEEGRRPGTSGRPPGQKDGGAGRQDGGRPGKTAVRMARPRPGTGKTTAAKEKPPASVPGQDELIEN